MFVHRLTNTFVVSGPLSSYTVENDWEGREIARCLNSNQEAHSL